MSIYKAVEIEMLAHCTLCPHSCGVDRLLGGTGYCRSDAGFNISSICVHHGEEPAISGSKGICNVFFSHCNMQCIYCQNYHISRNTEQIGEIQLQFENVVHSICQMLEQTENIVGFVSPTHQIPQVMAIIRGIKQQGKHPVFVYNTNGYDKKESLQMLEGYIDVYLPDFKYADKLLALQYSDVRDYPETAVSAIQEMFRQKGSTLLVNDDGVAQSGTIIRHLILPGAIEQSMEVLRIIAEEISPDLTISLMSQYYPTPLVSKHHKLNRTINQFEYNKVLHAFHKFGFYRGWTQDLDSHALFRPNFESKHPFKSST